jgi:hypothetical protein
MTRTQIQLPDELYRRAKAFSAEREISLAEMTRRGLEMLLERYPQPGTAKKDWKLPKVHSGGPHVPLEMLKDIVHEEEAMRSLGDR